jgi:CheY-like chemotaxis protein
MTGFEAMTESIANLLLVDDDEAKRYLIATWLRQAGHTVVEVGTGQEALRNLGVAELVLLDVNLPDMSGFEVCRLIKANPKTASTPVIQVSATAVEVADRAHGLTQGADAYLTDPSEPEELLATVTAVLRYARARQRAERTAAMLPVLPGEVADRVLGPREASAVAAVSREDWLRLVPDSTLRVDVCIGVARTKPGKLPVAIVVSGAGIASDEDFSILRQLAQSIALGVEALRSSAEEHMVALTLQRSFLPAALPAIPGVMMAVRYLPASDQAEVGGDFYEALPWRGGVLVAIGDVQGHSLRAATVMGELRHALHAFASEGHQPLAITGLINEVLRRYHPGIIATLCLVLLDSETGELSIVNCGHMPLLLLGGSGAAYVGEGGIMLGLSRHEPHVETAFLPAGGTALLFTDGLVEDRQVLLDDNLEKLRAAAVQAAGADIEAFANHVLTLFGSSEDDVALIALRRVS